MSESIQHSLARMLSDLTTATSAKETFEEVEALLDRDEYLGHALSTTTRACSTAPARAASITPPGTVNCESPSSPSVRTSLPSRCSTTRPGPALWKPRVPLRQSALPATWPDSRALTEIDSRTALRCWV